MCQRLQFPQMRTTIGYWSMLFLSLYSDNSLQQSASQPAEVRVFRVIDLGNTPGVYPGTNGLPVTFNLLLATHNGKRKKRLRKSVLKRKSCPDEDVTYAEFTIVLDGFLVILLNIIREVVDRNVKVLDVLHDLEKKKNNEHRASKQDIRVHTLFLKPRSSLGVKESALPMTGITLTRGERRRINSMSISLNLKTTVNHVRLLVYHD